MSFAWVRVRAKVRVPNPNTNPGRSSISAPAAGKGVEHGEHGSRGAQRCHGEHAEEHVHQQAEAEVDEALQLPSSGQSPNPQIPNSQFPIPNSHPAVATLSASKNPEKACVEKRLVNKKK